MKNSDVIVIGGGLSGFIAALSASTSGKKVTLLAYGSGSFPQNSGAIDVLCYDEEYNFISSPKEGIEKISGKHLYKKIGVEKISDALNFFAKVTEKFSLPYKGSFDKQIPIVTAVGTIKHSCLVPESLDASGIFSAKKICVVGVKCLKDFYPEMIVGNLKKIFPDKNFETTELDFELSGGRDITSLDAARFLHETSHVAGVVEKLSKFAGTGTILILPPIFGAEDGKIFAEVKNKLGAEIIETTCLPPSPPGIRLQKVLLKALRENGVTILEHTKIIGAEKSGRKCTGVIAQTATREKIYRAENFISATGGFYGGGIFLREFDLPKEFIFDLPVYFPEGAENWSNEKLFSDKPQGFATTGILTDENLNPVDAKGEKIFDNVRIVGANLGGFDFCFEHSGNGVAIASGYKAGQI